MKKLFILLIVVNTTSLFSQNVGINSTGTAPDASAMLDVSSTSKGLLIPRVALTALNAAGPITTPLTSLLVYNTATAGTAPNDVVPGYYYWDGTKWVALGGTGSKNWSLTGNSGTTVGTNFLGTTDNVDLMFKSNNVKSGLINNASNITTFGYQAGLNTTGLSNSFFGVNTGSLNITGVSNTGMGYNALSNATNSYNTAIGVTSLRNLTTGGSNTFMGVSSGFYQLSGTGNTGIGMYAAEGGNGTATGNYNTAVGYAAGSGFSGTVNYLPITSGSYNSFLGYGSALNSGAFNNASAIGAYALAGADNVMVLGGINGVNTATVDTKVGIGTTTPLYPLHVVTSAFVYAGRFENSNATNFALIGRNTAATGVGVGSGVYGYTGMNGGNGVFGKNINTAGTAILGAGQNVGGFSAVAGSGGAFSGSSIGMVADASSATGTGVRVTGQGVAAYPGLVAGSGGAFAGTTTGIYGVANNTGNGTWGGYFTNGSATAYAYVGGRTGGTDYKINGPGSVSTIVKNTKGEFVILYCPESPEILFQDFGKGTLKNGFVHIELDKDFAKNVTINEKHPLRVIVQLEGDCKGVFVTNQTATGFDVKELQGGNSNVTFTYFVTANRADGEGVDGSKNADIRFGEAPLK